jgi:hypothetical protein
MNTRNRAFFPGLKGLKTALDRHIHAEPTTDRGLTGIAARGVEDAQERIAKQQAKRARRAARAKAGAP